MNITTLQDRYKEKDNISIQNGKTEEKRKRKGGDKIFVFQIRRRGNRTRKDIFLFIGVGSRIGNGRQA